MGWRFADSISIVFHNFSHIFRVLHDRVLGLDHSLVVKQSPYFHTSIISTWPTHLKLKVTKPSRQRTFPKLCKLCSRRNDRVNKLNRGSEKFTQAIEIEPQNHVLYSNRSGAYASSKEFDLALEDAEKTTEIKPDWAKGWGRKGAALHGTGDLGKAFLPILSKTRVDS